MKNKNNRLQRLVACLLVLVFLGSGAAVVQQMHEQRLADDAYQAAADLALSSPRPDVTPPPMAEPEVILPDPEVPLAPAPEVTPEPSPEPSPEPAEPLPAEAEVLLDTDLDALRQTNGDVLAWICIPDTNISYPVMRSADNNEYLHLTWDLKSSAAGSIFLERMSSPDFSDFNTIVYGHNMKNGSMFSHLRKYQKQDFLDSHPCVYIVTDTAILRYEIFSAYTADITGDTYRLYFEDEARRQTAIDYYLDQAQTAGSAVPTTADRILTLSTCTGGGNYNYRWVVQAVLTGEFPR